MGNETTNSGVLGMLGRFSTALGANAADLAHLEGARLHPLLLRLGHWHVPNLIAFGESRQDAY